MSCFFIYLKISQGPIIGQLQVEINVKVISNCHEVGYCWGGLMGVKNILGYPKNSVNLYGFYELSGNNGCCS